MQAAVMAGSAENLSVQVVANLQALENLESEWLALFESCDGATPFQHPDWILPWARHFAVDSTFALALRSYEQHLVGLALLFRYVRNGSRIIACLGGGLSDHHELLALPSLEDAATRALFGALADSDAWDLFELDQLSETSPLARTELPPGLIEQHRGEADPCPILHLPIEGAALLNAVPTHQLARFRKYRRRAEKLGELSLVRADVSNCEAMLTTLFDLHAACWKARNEPGVAADPNVQAFHREVVGRAARSGSLRLYALRAGTKTIASLYGFFMKERLSCYWQGFDPEMAAVSPGMLVVGSVLEDAALEGARCVDFLRGEEAYKFQWGAVSERVFRRRIGRGSGL